MLDKFEIFTATGVVLWSKSYTPVKANVINSFIRDVFNEQKVQPTIGASSDASASQNPSYKKDQYTLRWTSVKDLGLIFVVRQIIGLVGPHLTGHAGGLSVSTPSDLD